jgi:hypothetical protein
MTVARGSARTATVLMAALLAGAVTAAQAQNAASIGDKDAIFVDGKKFQIVPGKGQADAADLIKNLGAREIGPGAIIFRKDDKLYIAGAPAVPSTAAPEEKQVGPIFIEYEPPKNPEHQAIYERVKERHLLEMFKQLLSPVRLPVDLQIKTLGCDGVANAYFDRQGKQRTIRICYEYLKQLVDTLPKDTTPEGITPHDALIGQMMFALLHESGHAMFDIFEVPIFGHQEDAADQFATFIMLQFGGGQAHRLIKGSAWAYHGYIKSLKDKPDVKLPLAAFSSDHGQPEERFFNLACMAYGYDPKEFAVVVEKEYLPQSRAKKCKFEYEDLTYAFQTLIRPHVDMELARKVLDTKWLTSDSSPAPAK